MRDLGKLLQQGSPLLHHSLPIRVHAEQQYKSRAKPSGYFSWARSASGSSGLIAARRSASGGAVGEVERRVLLAAERADVAGLDEPERVACGIVAGGLRRAVERVGDRGGP